MINGFGAMYCGNCTESGKWGAMEAGTVFFDLIIIPHGDILLAGFVELQRAGLDY